MTYTHLTTDELVMIESYYHQNIKIVKIVEYLKRCRRPIYYGFNQGKEEHRTIKYLNNLIEQDHRPVRRNKFYRSLRTASTTIKGMEAIRGLYKKTRKEGTLFGFSVCTEIKVLLGIPA
ncbi:DDE-type integrase/transposase/recombinase [Enterococcus faecium]|uniref:DDE-type integrase/transposase/recombinase n=1 Tax=Enterococcus faecium TaxID=1352 RepID=UPI003CC5DF63